MRRRGLLKENPVILNDASRCKNSAKGEGIDVVTGTKNGSDEHF